MAAIWNEIPQWRLGGTRSISARSLSYEPPGAACLTDEGTVALIGDSHVAGSRINGRYPSFGQVLEQALGRRVKVKRLGVGGHTARDGETAWAKRDLPEANLAVLVYGTNDAAPRGWLRNKRPAGIAPFKASLQRQIRGWKVRGAQVVLLAPPPGGSTAIARRLHPYRLATREVGLLAGVTVLDPAEAFASCSETEPLLMYDALHMNKAGQQCLGKWLARKLCAHGNRMRSRSHAYLSPLFKDIRFTNKMALNQTSHPFGYGTPAARLRKTARPQPGS